MAIASSITLRLLLGAGQRRQSEGMVGLRVQRELQIDRAKADAAFAGQRFAQPIENFGQTFRGAVDEKRDLFLGVDLIAQILGQRVWVAL